ncbi:hypothetical protein PPYR_07980 [Photinus pyralis]|uniref:Mitochondrial inner membrane protease subunit n=1 Tax=Photinus pyralis TaxID=7054 RepID=A0A5N4ARZ3_PHOPY|nr:mitochondrial inner membrane protease subunit 1 [Photinus pyralis]KAB0800100.1 hypothetical protein PPYR_07980 [Photinus pyralis]
MKSLTSKLIKTVGYIIQYGCVVHCVSKYLGDIVMCSGRSMEPTVYSDDIVFIEHLSPRFRYISRGDVIIAKCPTNPKQYICKRVVGLPGDKIKTGFTTSQTVPPAHVWLEGDNRENSSDSRAYGPVPLGLICSRAMFVIWPFKHIGSFV